MTPAERRLNNAIEKLQGYIESERIFVNGGIDERVETPNGSYPTLAGIARRGEEAAAALDTANSVLAEAQQLRDTAQASASSAISARQAADAARAEAVDSATRLSSALAMIEQQYGLPLLVNGTAY